MEQDKPFRWAKSLLEKDEKEIETILDFTKEEVLASLFELLDAKRKVEKLMPHPKRRIEHLQNLNTILSFARNELQLRNLQISGEELLDPNADQAAKAVRSMLSLVFKKYGEEPDIVAPLLEWARIASDVEIPTLKSMQDGRAFLSIISKLSDSIDQSKGEEVNESSKDNESATNPNEEPQDSAQVEDQEYNETDLQFNNHDQTVISDAVGMALFLVKRKFNIVPPFTSYQISSGSASSILSFLSLLHNVAVVNQTKTEVNEANSKTTSEIVALREANLQLEAENEQMATDRDVKLEQVKTENLLLEMSNLLVQLAELKLDVAEISRVNEIQREKIRLREKEKLEREILFKFQLEKHVFLLRENLVMLGNVGPILAEIHDQLNITRQMTQGLPAEAQLHYLYLQVDAEAEGIASLQTELATQLHQGETLTRTINNETEMDTQLNNPTPAM